MNEFDMESYIDKRMLEIQDLDQRILYKDIVGDLLKKIYQYNEQAYKELEHRILNEANARQSDFTVYITLTDRNHYDATDYYMHTMKSVDAEKKELSFGEIKQAMTEKVPLKLYTVFIQTNASSIFHLLHSGRKFQGIIKTKNREYKGTFIVRQNKDYLDMIKNLYDIFLVNYQSWNTVCEAYLTKLLDVYLCDIEKMEKNEEIEEIKIDFEEYSELIYHEAIPLWNLKEIKEKTSTYPDAAIDKINYEHLIFAHRLNPECEYLVMNTDVEITNIRRTDGDLIITCPVDRPVEWKLYQVNKVNAGRKYLYPLLSNQYKESFSGNLAETFRKSIKTKAEMVRLIESFPYNNFMKFQGYEIVQDVPEECLASNYNMDGFIEDEIRIGNVQQVLLLSFLPADADNYLNEDIMSFLVTQVQKIFPEYQCIGQLV